MLGAVLLLAELVSAASGPRGPQAPYFRLHNAREISSREDALVFRLRSKLMTNNYDYDSVSSEKMLRGTLREKKEEAKVDSDEETRKDDSDLSDFKVDRNVLNGYISDWSDTNAKPAGTKDKNTTQATAKDEWFKVINPAAARSPYLAQQDTTTQLSYKVLTARGKWRRSGGGGAVHRYLQTELNDTVVVAPLQFGPLPDFRLPKSRRQYREDSDGEDADVSTMTEDDDALEPA